MIGANHRDHGAAVIRTKRGFGSFLCKCVRRPPCEAVLLRSLCGAGLTGDQDTKMLGDHVLEANM
jgi:hypothetical protein